MKEWWHSWQNRYQCSMSLAVQSPMFSDANAAAWCWSTIQLHQNLSSAIFDSGRPERRYIRTPQECGPCSPTKHFSAAWLYRICRRHTGKRDYDETSILDFYNFWALRLCEGFGRAGDPTDHRRWAQLLPHHEKQMVRESRRRSIGSTRTYI